MPNTLTRTTRFTRQVAVQRLPRPQLRRPSLSRLIDRAEAAERAVSPTQEGHLRPLHWALIAAGLLAVAYAPLALPYIPANFPYFQLPLALALLACLPLAHSVGGRKSAVLAEELADGRQLWDLSHPHEGYTTLVTSLALEYGQPVTYVHGVRADGQVSEQPLIGTLGGRHDHRAAVELAGYGVGGDA